MERRNVARADDSRSTMKDRMFAESPPPNAVADRWDYRSSVVCVDNSEEPQVVRGYD